MTNEVAIEAETIEPVKSTEADKIDALRKHMLLTVDSMCIVFNVSRVSYYNWLKGKSMRKKTADTIRRIVRKLVIIISQYDWPNPSVYVANQPQRLKMLQKLLIDIDKETEEQ